MTKVNSLEVAYNVSSSVETVQFNSCKFNGVCVCYILFYRESDTGHRGQKPL